MRKDDGMFRYCQRIRNQRHHIKIDYLCPNVALAGAIAGDGRVPKFRDNTATK